MTDQSTRRIISAYLEEATPPMFFNGFFKSPPQNFFDSELVEIDVMRDSEDVAIVIQDLSTGARQNELAGYTNKAFAPPIFDEEATVNSWDLIKRGWGESPFDNPDFQAQTVLRSFAVFRRLENKIRRAFELQCAQVLSTGKITLTDQAGLALYFMDFLPKATHFTTVTTAWAADGQTGAPFTDIAALANTIRTDGRLDPNTLVMGSTAIERFMVNKQVTAQLASFGMQNLQALKPETRGQGATFYGRFFIGQYWYNVYSYTATYKHPQTGAATPYLHPEKVIVLADNARLDACFGSIPRLVAPDPRVAGFIPARISGGAQGVDLTTFAWITPEGKHLKVSCGTRPIAIPTAIDTFGALDMVP